MQNDIKQPKSTAEKVKLWRKNIKSKIVASLGDKCVCCGYNKCYDALELHHLNPLEKDFSFGSIRANPQSWEKIVREIKKCILVCANCHREIHKGITNIPEVIPVFDERYADYNFGLEKDRCPVCGKYKEIQYKTCSKKCAGKLSWTIDWSKFDLYDLMIIKQFSIQDVANLVGVSYGAIKRQMKLLGIISSLKIIKKPSKNELIKLIEQKPILQIAKELGVKSDNTVRKWCVNYDIDYKNISKFSRENRQPKMKKERKNFPSKYLYVSFNKTRNTWCANIKLNEGKGNLFKRCETELKAAQLVAEYFNSTELILRK